MEKYKKYKEAFPNKTDAQCIESLCNELSDKVETIHKLLAEIELLKQSIQINLQDDFSGSEQIICPACNGKEYSETDGIYECAYTDCGFKFIKSFL
jgi:hypothetical protein